MPKPLNLLLVEDVQNDADLMLAELRHAGFDPQWKRVQTEPDFLAEIEKCPDIILSDYSMPQFSGLRAVELLQRSGLDIPFILISGTVGEESAVEAMKHGATDYLLKDRIGRLAPAVHRALEQKRLRAERKHTELELKLFRTLVDQASDGIEVVDPRTGRFLDVNETTCRRLGYTRQEMLTMGVLDIEVKGVDSSTWRPLTEEIRQAGFKTVEGVHKRKDGSTFPVEVSIHYVQLERDYLIASVRDITERKKLEADVALREQQLDAFFTGAVVGLALLNSELRYVQLNTALAEMNGLPVEEHIGRTVREVLPRFAPLIEPFFQKVLATNESFPNVEFAGETPQQPGVQRFWVESIFPVAGRMNSPGGIGIIVVEITERKRAEMEIQNQLKELQRWHEAMLGREDRILALKQEVNELLTQLQQPARYGRPPTP